MGKLGKFKVILRGEYFYLDPAVVGCTERNLLIRRANKKSSVIPIVIAEILHIAILIRVCVMGMRVPAGSRF